MNYYMMSSGNHWGTLPFSPILGLVGFLISAGGIITALIVAGFLLGFSFCLSAPNPDGVNTVPRSKHIKSRSKQNNHIHYWLTAIPCSLLNHEIILVLFACQNVLDHRNHNSPDNTAFLVCTQKFQCIGIILNSRISVVIVYQQSLCWRGLFLLKWMLSKTKRGACVPESEQK